MIRPTDLLMSYVDFNDKIKTIDLTEEERQWYHEWQSWDIACSPMDDEARRFIRYGHFLGYFAKS